MAELDFRNLYLQIGQNAITGQLISLGTSLFFLCSKTWRAARINSDEIESIQWHPLAEHWAIRIFNKDGLMLRFGGFRENAKSKLAKFFSNRFSKKMADLGATTEWNWDRPIDNGAVLCLEVGDREVFDIPLPFITQWGTGENGGVTQFIEPDDAQVGVAGLRGQATVSRPEPVVNVSKEQVLHTADTETEQTLRTADTETEQTLRTADTETEQTLRTADTETEQVLRTADTETEQTLRTAVTETEQVLRTADTETVQFLCTADTETEQVLRTADTKKEQVLRTADTNSTAEELLASFPKVDCPWPPRGEYNIDLFKSGFQLETKKFNCKIPMSSILNLFLLPHNNGRDVYFVISLDPPIKKGSGRYPLWVFQFIHRDSSIINFYLTARELHTKYEGRLFNDLPGPPFEVLGRTLKVLVNREITGPGNFLNYGQSSALNSVYRRTKGFIYPLERGFMFVPKALLISFEEVSGVNFVFGVRNKLLFEFDVETKNGVVHTFRNIRNEEYPQLLDFVHNKKLLMKSGDNLEASLGNHGELENKNAEEEPEVSNYTRMTRAKAEASGRSHRRDAAGGQGSEKNVHIRNPDAFTLLAELLELAKEMESSSNNESTESCSETSYEPEVLTKINKKPKGKAVELEPGYRNATTRTLRSSSRAASASGSSGAEFKSKELSSDTEDRNWDSI